MQMFTHFAVCVIILFSTDIPFYVSAFSQPAEHHSPNHPCKMYPHSHSRIKVVPTLLNIHCLSLSPSLLCRATAKVMMNTWQTSLCSSEERASERETRILEELRFIEFCCQMFTYLDNSCNLASFALQFASLIAHIVLSNYRVLKCSWVILRNRNTVISQIIFCIIIRFLRCHGNTIRCTKLLWL